MLQLSVNEIALIKIYAKLMQSTGAVKKIFKFF